MKSSASPSALLAKLPIVSIMSINLLEFSLQSWMTSTFWWCTWIKQRCTRLVSLSFLQRMSSPSISVIIISISLRNILETSLGRNDLSFFCYLVSVSSQFWISSTKACRDIRFFWLLSNIILNTIVILQLQLQLLLSTAGCSALTILGLQIYDCAIKLQQFKLTQPMIQRLLQIQKQRLKKQQQKIEQAQDSPHKARGITNIHLGEMTILPETTRPMERSKSGEELKSKHIPLTDRATFNRKMIFIKTRNRYSTYYLSKFKTNHIHHPNNQNSHDYLFATKNYFCPAPSAKYSITGKRSNLQEGNNIQQYLPTCSRIHKIGNKFEEPTIRHANFVEFKRSKSFTDRSLSKKRTVQFMNSTKIRMATEAQKSGNKGVLADSIQISPWKYSQ